MLATTQPGFSSRSTEHLSRQFPQRDERMDEHEQAGWSNSTAAEDAPQDVRPEIAEPEVTDPGFSNAKAVSSGEPEVEAKVVDEDSTEDKSVKPAKKTAAKKKG